MSSNILRILFMFVTGLTFVIGFAKPTKYTHNGKERFSSPIHSSIDKLTNYHNATAKSWLDCFFRGLSDIHECSGTHWMPLVGLYRQPPCWKSPPDSFMMWAIDLAIFLWHFECNGASFLAISPRKLLSFAVIHHFVATPYPLPIYKCLWCW